MRDTLDRITPMLGFKVRVTEKGGTTLESLLSNKNLWSGDECGRRTCRTCAQDDEKKEPCTLKNIIYESECAKCNPPGARKEQDKKGLEERRDVPSLYVGETARSVHERALEHWRDAENLKEESHMQEHQQASHGGEQPPAFKFRVVKKCKSSLERQVREAVRIQMRGNVLNKKGLYNRCKLTRLVVDEEWDLKVWQESWQPRGVATVDEECIRAENRGKKRGSENVIAKRIKLDMAEGVAQWGEGPQEQEDNRSTFLYEPPTQKRGVGKMRQPLLNMKPISGIEWLVRKMMTEVADTAVAISELTSGVETWVEWVEEEKEKEQESKRSSKEERWLWHRLDECDREQAKVEKLNNWKKGLKIARARKMMGVSSNQPSIKESVAKKSASLSSPSELVATGGPCHQIGGGAPPQQINTRARGQTSQKYDVSTSGKINLMPGQLPRLAPEHATNLEPNQPPGLVPSQAANIVQVNSMKIVDERNGVKVKTGVNKNAKNVNINVSKNVMNVKECQEMLENGQSEVGSVSCYVEVMNTRNGPSGLKDLETESLQTKNKKQTFKFTQTSNSRKINSSRNILPAVFTPTKRKLMEAKTVRNLISKFESSPAADPSGGGEGIIESPAKRRKCNLVAK